MTPHHQQTIANAERIFAADPTVIALLIGGSIAHGCARENSDVDIMIVVSPADYAARRATDQTLYLDFANCTYEGGYIDGKYVDIAFMQQVAEHGSEAARFAFQDAIERPAKAQATSSHMTTSEGRSSETRSPPVIPERPSPAPLQEVGPSHQPRSTPVW